jgi:DNA mismatch repair protein MutS
MSQLDDTPLMRQWREVKASHADALLFFRVGDFFELFYGDAEEGARLLGLTLTSRNNGSASRVPLAGVPVKALDEYLGRLLKLGRRVAICDQVEDPSEAKGIVRREVVETLTPGSVVQETLLRARRNNFLVAISPALAGAHGVAALDLSTGEFRAESVPAALLAQAIARLEPSELLLPGSLAEAENGRFAPLPPLGPLRTKRDDWVFDYPTATEALLRRFSVHGLDGMGFEKSDQVMVRAAGALVGYLQEIRPAGAQHLRPPRPVRSGDHMVLDEMTRRNLELVEPLRGGEQDGGTLLSVLDEAVTSMGGRLLRRWVLSPLVVAEQIWERQEAVGELLDSRAARSALRGALSRVADLERLAGRLGTRRVTPRDLLGLSRSLAELPEISASLTGMKCALMSRIASGLDLLADVRGLLDASLSEQAPVSVQEGNVIRAGFSTELDDLRATLSGAREFIAGLQARERARTGITSLKVGYNKVFGYYLEVTRANTARVPSDYHRKQTLTNAERYFTPELKEWEEKVFGAEERVGQLEAELFAELRAKVADQVGRLQATAERLACLDVLAALAEAADRRGYVRPDVHTGFDLRVRAGRHPVVETMMPRETFIPNDVVLEEDGRVVILTGPNMAGKSTVLRQVGLIQLLGQMGSFVPADEARLPVVDRVFTRVGASDNLTRGQSTFMVEMNETAAILSQATSRSLILLDEIGRGTSTYDGVSIAWALTEHLHERVGAKTVFATHYHELTQLGDLLPRVRNLNVSVREVGDRIVFLRRLEPGGADRSYGIQVAKLAGLPDPLLARARELLAELEGTHSGGGEGLGRRGRHRPSSEPPPDQLSFFHSDHPVVERLRELELERMTPLEALTLLAELQASVRRRG